MASNPEAATLIGGPRSAVSPWSIPILHLPSLPLPMNDEGNRQHLEAKQTHSLCPWTMEHREILRPSKRM